MAPSEEQERRDEPLSSFPEPVTDNSPSWAKPTMDADRVSIPSSSRSGSASEAEGTSRNGQKQLRPKLQSRKSSGTIIVPAASSQIEVDEEVYDEGDARTMSPRRSSEEVDRLEEGLRQNMIEQSRQLQASLLNLVDRVESVKAEHEKLEGGNRFLQSYIGELMQTSKITATGASKGKGKQRTK